MPRFTARMQGPDGVTIECDVETAELVADALDIINPDDGQHEAWARDCAFTLQSLLDRSGFPPTIKG